VVSCLEFYKFVECLARFISKLLEIDLDTIYHEPILKVLRIRLSKHLLLFDLLTRQSQYVGYCVQILHKWAELIYRL